MSGVERPVVSAVVLTMGDRPAELRRSCLSILADPCVVELVVVFNGADVGLSLADPRIRLIVSPQNVGIPAGRDLGLRSASGEVILFLDDDACLLDPLTAAAESFADDPLIGAASLRIMDESGRSLKRHVPRFFGRGPDREGRVGTFLGGACLVRRSAYLDSGGYWGELFYGHEELELAWRLADRGWTIRYLAGVRVEHPATSIARHPSGWFRTGRNRVLIARRSLPSLVAAAHVLTWLVAGLLRSPGTENRRAYLDGWRAGWAVDVARSPIRWSTVWGLARIGRPPIG